MGKKKTESVRISDDGDELIILDQTLLPGEEMYPHLTDIKEVFEAIRNLRLREAPKEARGSTRTVPMLLAS